MSDFITAIGSVLGMTVGTIGTLAVTLGTVAAAGLLISLSIKVFKRVFGR